MSSIQVEAWQVDQFGRTVRMLSEQRTSRLRRITYTEPFEGGELWSVDTFKSATDTPTEIVSLLTDTPNSTENYNRRWGVMRSFDEGTLIDKQQQVKLLTNPQSKMVLAHAMTMGRGIDDTIIGALNANVLVGKKSGSLTSTAFPAGQQIASSSTGLTIDKLIAARELFDAAEVDEQAPRYWITNAKGITNLLQEDKISSADYNTVKALVAGTVNSFMGFEFIRSQRLPVDGSSARLNFAVVAGAIAMAWGQEPTSYIDLRPDKRRATQVYTDGSWGALRVEDEKVIEVACVE